MSVSTPPGLYIKAQLYSILLMPPPPLFFKIPPVNSLGCTLLSSEDEKTNKGTDPPSRTYGPEGTREKQTAVTELLGEGNWDSGSPLEDRHEK